MGLTEFKANIYRLKRMLKSRDICITRYGKPVAYAVSAEQYRQLSAERAHAGRAEDRGHLVRAAGADRGEGRGASGRRGWASSA